MSRHAANAVKMTKKNLRTGSGEFMYQMVKSLTNLVKFCFLNLPLAIMLRCELG